MNTDEELRRDVIDELIWEAGVDAAKIDVKVDDGEVMLSGTVPSYYEKYIAGEAAERVVGVRSVRNTIDVELLPGLVRNDADLADAVKTTLIWNTAVPAENITIAVKDGWVLLDGQVEWHYQKRAAIDAVRSLVGVLGVTDRITVASAMELQSPEDKIRRALKRDALVDAGKIDVVVDGTEAILEGTAATWVERRRAERAAWSTPGIFTVDNNIAVGLPQTK